MSSPREDELIATYFAPLAGQGGFGLLDDAAVLRTEPGHDLVTTVDALVANVHFFPDDPPGAIAAKALGVNVSDLAAKAADPVGFLLALALPNGVEPDWLEAFSEGLGSAAARHGCPLLGGDTVRTSGPLTLSITAFGTVPVGRMLPRTGVRPGDRIYVSGTIGDSALGLALRTDVAPGLQAALVQALSPSDCDFLRDRFLLPQPRLGLRTALRSYARAGMDVSDGLVGDLRKMLRASGVGGRVDLGRAPHSPAARRAIKADAQAWSVAVTGGDDYEILVSVPAPDCAAFEAAAAESGIPVTAIGEALDGEDIVFFDASGTRVDLGQGSFQHF